MHKENSERRDGGQEKIIAALRGKPRSHGDLVKITRLAPSTITYHLKQLTEKKVLRQTEEKLYRIADEEEVELAIMGFLMTKELTSDEILQSPELLVFSEKLSQALESLLLKGLLEEKHIENQLGKYKLSWRSCRRLNICYVCNKPPREGAEIDSHIIETLEGLDCISLTSSFIHPECFSAMIELQNPYVTVTYDKNCFCGYCGLPLSPKDLRSWVEHTDVTDLMAYLSTKEVSTYERISAQYDKNEFPYRFIDSLSTLELFFREIKNGLSPVPEETSEDYDPLVRAKETFTIWEKIRTCKKQLGNRVIELLNGPVGLVYENLLLIEDSRLRLLSPSREVLSNRVVTDSDHSLVIRKGQSKYHLYCASLLEKIHLTATEEKVESIGGN